MVIKAGSDDADYGMIVIGDSESEILQMLRSQSEESA